MHLIDWAIQLKNKYTLISMMFDLNNNFNVCNYISTCPHTSTQVQVKTHTGEHRYADFDIINGKDYNPMD